MSNKHNDSFNSLFNKGVKISVSIFFIFLLFLVFWIIGQEREHIMIQNSSTFSRVFFFLNPNIFHKIFIQGNIISFLTGSVSFDAFLFMVCYLSTFLLFAITFVLCGWLFFIAYSTCVKPFHYISCLALFPILGGFFISLWVFKLFIYVYEMKKKKISRFEDDFSPEWFEDQRWVDIDCGSSIDRDITTLFTKKHYDKFFHNNKKDWLVIFRDKLAKQLS